MCETGKSALPALYALTSAKLYGLIRRILPDETLSSNALSEVYRHVWASRHSFKDPVTMSTLLTIAQRFALDYRMAGGPIARVGTEPRNVSRRIDDLSDSDVDILCRAYAEAPHKPLEKQALLVRLGALTTHESSS